jgi:hypothetical protein
VLSVSFVSAILIQGQKNKKGMGLDMTTWAKTATFFLAGTTLMAGYGFAADVGMKSDLPAVSAINGKVQASAGWVDMNNVGSDSLFRGAASLSMPVGDRFGLQADFAALNEFNDTAVTGTLHAFTRDPNSYLFGAIGGYGEVSSTKVWYVGPEAELYLDNISLEASGGLMNVDFGASSQQKAFVLADVGFYATENLRLTVGASSIADFNAGHAGMEWLLGDMGVPVSFTVDGRIGENGFKSINAGFTFYFGGDGNKSLMHRQREDDPRNRSLDIFGAAGSAFTPPPPAATVPVDPCLAPIPPPSCLL